MKLNYVYADLDIAKAGDGKTREERDELKLDVLMHLQEKCPPTFVIGTSNGIQPLWKLEDMPITPENKKLYTKVIKGVIEWSKEYKCKADGVFDVARILRYPNYYHQKEEPYLCEVIFKDPNRKVYSLTELEKIFPYEEPTGKQVGQYSLDRTSPKQPTLSATNVVFEEIEKLDFQELMIRAFASVGRTAEFDKTGRLILDSRLTGTFQGRKDDRNYLASTSHEPFKGNRITAVADILGITAKDAYRWITDEYNLDYRQLSTSKKSTSQINELNAINIEDDSETEEKKLRYTWGTRNLDINLAIIKRGDFIVMGASRGSGKTTFTFDMACKNAMLGHKVLYLSLEMEKKEIMEDFARRSAAITIEEEYDYDIPDYKQCKFKEKLESFKKIPNLFFEGVRRGQAIIWDTILKVIDKYKDLDLIIIDNLDLIEADEREHELDKQKRVTKSMMNFTSSRKIPIILIHHQRKKGMGGKDFGMDELSGSGKISDNADRVVLISRNKAPDAVYPDKYRSSIYLHKARGYCEAIVNVYFISGTFVDTPPPDPNRKDFVVEDIIK